MLIYICNGEIQVYHKHVRRLAIMKATGELCLKYTCNINTYMYIVYIKLRQTSRHSQP